MSALPRRLLNVAIALAACASVCVGLNTILPSPKINQVTSKLRFFEAHKDEFDTLFLGSSHIYYQLSPALFDEEMRQRGCPSHSFNLGIEGMFPPEIFYVADRVFEMKPRHLRRVIVELGDLLTRRGTYEGGTTQRMLYWHDWSRTALVLEKLLKVGHRESWKRKLQRVRSSWDPVALDLTLFARRETNIGRGFEISGAFGHRRDQAEAQKVLGPLGDGYSPSRAKISANGVITYENDLARETTMLRPRKIDPYAEKAYRRCAEQIRAAGAMPIFVVGPGLRQTQLSFAEAPPPPGPVISFNNCRAYPELYRPEVRADSGHVNAEGSERFTKLLAGRVATYSSRFASP